MPDKLDEIIKDPDFQKFSPQDRRTLIDDALKQTPDYGRLSSEDQGTLRRQLYSQYVSGGTQAPSSGGAGLLPASAPGGQGAVLGAIAGGLPAVAPSTIKTGSVAKSQQLKARPTVKSAESSTPASTGSVISPQALRDKKGNLARTTIGPPHPTPEPNLFQKAVGGLGAVLGYPKALISASTLGIHHDLNTGGGQLPASLGGTRLDEENVQRLLKMNPFQRAAALEGENPIDPLIGRPHQQALRNSATFAQFGAADRVMNFATGIATDPVTYVFGPLGEILPAPVRAAIEAAFGAQAGISGVEHLARGAKTKDRAEIIDGVLDMAMGGLAARGMTRQALTSARADLIAARVLEHAAESKPGLAERLASRYNVPHEALAKALNKRINRSAAHDDAVHEAAKPLVEQSQKAAAATAIAQAARTANAKPAVVPEAVKGEVVETRQAQTPAAAEAQAAGTQAGQAPISAKADAAAAVEEVKKGEVVDNQPQEAGTVTIPKTGASERAEAAVPAKPAAAVEEAKPATTQGKAEVKPAAKGLPATIEGHEHIPVQLVRNPDFPRYDVIRTDTGEAVGPGGTKERAIAEAKKQLDFEKRQAAAKVAAPEPEPAAASRRTPRAIIISKEHTKAVARLLPESDPLSSLLYNADAKSSIPLKDAVRLRALVRKSPNVTEADFPDLFSERTNAAVAELEKGGAPTGKPIAKPATAPNEFSDWVGKQSQDRAAYTSAASLLTAYSKEHPEFKRAYPRYSDAKVAFGQMLHGLPRDQWNITPASDETAFEAKSSTGEIRKFGGISRVKTEPTPAIEAPKPVAPEPPRTPPAGTDTEGGAYTGARNKIVEDKERLERGLSPVERQDYVTVGDAFLLGKRAVTEGAVDHHALAAEVSAKPRVLSAEEVGTLAYGRRLIKYRYDALGAEIDKAIADKNQARIKELQPELSEAEEQFKRNDEALVRGGREQSAAFAARKMVLSDEGNLLEVLTNARRKAGRDLTASEKAKFEAMAKELAEAKISEQQAHEQTARSDAEAAVERIARVAQQSKTKGRVKELRAEREALIKALTEASKPRLSSGPGQIVDVSIILGKLAVNYIHEGIVTLPEIVEKIQADFPQFTERHIHDALSGYGRAVKPASEVQRKITELKKEAKLTSQTADEPAIDTRVPKKPSETDNPHIISMRAELGERQKQRTRREQIAEIEARLASGDIEQKGIKKAYPKDTDETRLAELRKDYSEAQNRIAAIEDLHRRIELEKNKIDTRAKPGEPRKQSEEEQSLRAELAEYHRQRNTKEAIDALQDKLNKGEIDPLRRKTDRPRTEDTEKLAALQKEYRERQADLTRLDALRAQIDMERRGVDTRTPAQPRKQSTEEQALRDERDKLRAERDRQAKIEETTGKLNRSEIEPNATPANLPKTESEIRLAQLEKEYRRRQAELARIPDLEDRLAKEEAGTDTRQKQPQRVQSPEEIELRKKIGTEQKLRDIHAEIDKLQSDLDAGIFREPIRTENTTDPRLKAAMDKRAFIQARIRSEIEAMKPKSGLDRVVDFGRAMKLAGVGVFAKLGGASAWAMPVETLANALGVIPGKFRVKGKPLASIADREGQFSLGTELKGYRAFLSKEAVSNARDVFTQGFNKIHAEAGADSHGGDLASIPGRLHGGVKSFLQTAEYAKAFGYRMNRAASKAKAAGEAFNPNDPETITRIGYEAAVDAQTMILQGDNALASAITGTANAIEGAGKNKGPVGEASAKLGAAFLRTLIPITKVPANYLGKAIRSTGLGVVEGAYRQVKAQRSAEPLTPKEADSIIQAYKYGGLGLVAAFIGLVQPAFFKAAGFYPDYRKGTRPNKDKDGKEMNPSEFQVAGVRVPHQIAHAPFLEAVQFWATVRRGVEQQKTLKGIGEAVKGMGEQAPGLESITAGGQALVGEGYDPSGFWGDYLRGMVEPQFMNEIAKYQDIGPRGIPNIRKSTGFGAKIQAGIPEIPGLPKLPSRKKLPLKTQGTGGGKLTGFEKKLQQQEQRINRLSQPRVRLP